MFIGCTHVFRLLRRTLLLHIILCKTSTVKFSIAVEVFTCALFKDYWITGNILDSRELDWTRLGVCAHPVTPESGETRLDSASG